VLKTPSKGKEKLFTQKILFMTQQEDPIVKIFPESPLILTRKRQVFTSMVDDPQIQGDQLQFLGSVHDDFLEEHTDVVIKFYFLVFSIFSIEISDLISSSEKIVFSSRKSLFLIIFN